MNFINILAVHFKDELLLTLYSVKRRTYCSSCVDVGRGDVVLAVAVDDEVKECQGKCWWRISIFPQTLPLNSVSGQGAKDISFCTLKSWNCHCRRSSVRCRPVFFFIVVIIVVALLWIVRDEILQSDSTEFIREWELSFGRSQQSMDSGRLPPHSPPTARRKKEWIWQTCH